MIETGLRDKVVIVTGAAAGILRDGQLAKYKEGALAAVMSDEQFDSVIAVNLKGVFTCTRAVVPRKIEGGGVQQPARGARHFRL
jgi:NAD(P)-dependent dehydrogenase (short-subunit alcohol dehydrogenase family)